MSSNIYSIGKHYILDVYNCEVDKLKFRNTIETTLNKIVDILQLTKVNESYKQFYPVGVTGFILLEESHVSIHTWPENNFAAIDIFSCRSNLNIERIKQLLEKEFGSEKINMQLIDRGVELLQELT